MAVVVVGGHSRNVGKTSVVAGLIAALPEMRWTAAKITQFGHGVCSANGESCHCATDEHTWRISQEHDRSGSSDTSRFLLAGAERAFWVRTQQGMLAEAMPDLRSKLAGAANVIIESNSVVRFLRPDLYLAVLDPAIADFKQSARDFLDRADGLIVHRGKQVEWSGIPLKLLAGRPVFRIDPPEYVAPELATFVRSRLRVAACARQRE